MEAKEALAQAAKNMGSYNRLAKAMKISRQAVSAWKLRGQTPASRVAQLSKLSGVAKADLRPDIYGSAEAMRLYQMKKDEHARQEGERLTKALVESKLRPPKEPKEPKRLTRRQRKKIITTLKKKAERIIAEFDARKAAEKAARNA